MKKLIVFVFVLSGFLILTGCEKKNDVNPIVGKWVNGAYVYTFNEDNTCTYDANGTKMDCTYEITDDKISILYKNSTSPFETTYKIKNNLLTIKDSFGSNVIYEKK